MGKITDEQKKILENFSCERLSSNPENRSLIKSFVSEKGSLLVDYLHNLAWDEDVECKTAYYLVKSPKNEIALFFSLKCGALFDPSKSMPNRLRSFWQVSIMTKSMNKTNKLSELGIHIQVLI